MAGVSLVGVNATMGAIRPSAGFLIEKLAIVFGGRSRLSRHTGACWTTMFFMYNSSSSRLFESAFASAFFNSLRMNLTDFSGQRPKSAWRGCEAPCCDHRPAGKPTLSSTELFSLRSATNTPIKSPERDDLLVLLDISEVTVGLG